MRVQINRRDFLMAGAAASAAFAIPGVARAAAFKTTLKKALIGSANEDTLKTCKAAGFDGIETADWKMPIEKAAAVRKFAESIGMRIHSVMFGWASFNGGPEAVEKSIADVKTALSVAAAYGADAVLVVPCRIDVKPMPKPWEFDIRFDEKTNYLKQVVAGDNSPYQKYIEAHNHATDASREAVKKLIPFAEKENVIIALENVWNNLWVQPAVSVNFIRSFQHPLVKAYFDIGNNLKYAKPQDWIRQLGGDLLVKCHVKDYDLGPDGHNDDIKCFCNIREGSVDWPAVRQALDDIGYNGFLTIEGGDLSPEEHSRRLDLIIAGK